MSRAERAGPRDPVDRRDLAIEQSRAQMSPAATVASTPTPTPIIVVTGPPASGKTTLATHLADELSLPLVSKDEIKESLYDSLGAGDHDWSRRLGRATYPLLFLILRRQLRARRPVIVEATFGRDDANAAFARIHAEAPFRALQLHCAAPPEVLIARYRQRAQGRHPGHLDAAIVDDVEEAIRAGRWEALDLPGDCVVLDTSRLELVDLGSIVRIAREHLG